MARKATANSVSRLLGSNIHFRRSTAPGFSFIRDAWGRSIAVKQPFEQVAELWTVARCRWIAHYGKVP